MKVGDRIKIDYSHGVTIGTILSMDEQFLYFKSRGMGSITILKSRVKPLSKAYRGAIWRYQSFN